MKIYLAGPLFTESERVFNSELAYRLRLFGCTVLVPQELEPRDSDELGQGIFNADLAALNDASVVLANMDGADVDSGTAWECGYAYAKGKLVLLYRTDFRTCREIGDARFNLMLWHGVQDSRDRISMCTAPGNAYANSLDLTIIAEQLAIAAIDRIKQYESSLSSIGRASP